MSPYDVHPKRNAAVLLAVIMISGIGTALYMYAIDSHVLTYYGDAASHLIAARKLFDWKENPGWEQLGTVWLPLPHFLLMFPSLMDGLFFTGFAGLAISLPSLAFTSVFLYMIITRVLSKIPNVNARFVPYIAFAGALLYALNPNFLYVGMTAMTEAPFMLFFTGSAYYLLRWTEEYREGGSRGLRYLALCSVFVSAATLCRYEGWILPLVLIASVTMKVLHRSKDGIEEENVVNRKILYAAAVAIVSFAGIGFWLVYNDINYGDPLEFANAQYYSAASQALDRSIRENLFLQPYNVISVYGTTATIVYGPVLAVAALGYVFHHRVKEGRNVRRNLFVFLASAPVFTVISMLVGIGEMTFWFNSRFVMFLAPFAIALSAVFVVSIPRLRNNSRLLFGVLASLFVFQLAMASSSLVVTLIDAKNGYGYMQAPFAVQTGEQIGSLYDGNGSIMIVTGSAHEHRIQVASGIPLKNFDSVIQSSTNKRSFLEPWNYGNGWIIIGKEPNSDGVKPAQYWRENRDELDLHYQTVYENQYFEILARK